MAKVFLSDLTDKKPYKVTVTTGSKSKRDGDSGNGEFNRFEKLTKDLLAVPKAELDAKRRDS